MSPAALPEPTDEEFERAADELRAMRTTRASSTRVVVWLVFGIFAFVSALALGSAFVGGA